MKQFNLEEWLQDKSRKVMTRDGREVEILKTDFRGYKQIIGVVKNRDNKDDEVDQWDKEGNFRGIFGESKYDLFFADEEEELTEFEERIYTLINFSDPDNFPSIKEVKEESEILLDLARKELLKDLPKWKKATENKDFDNHVLLFEDEDRVVLTEGIYKDEYYIELDDLKNLPKEE